ncbi:protein ALP1-like [Chenopodium quinoa]|uniref:protein ALP1-like n=1 Tax=Chenopodium quinoa TaxID=63459 RepID=UPI000B77D11B|nr:protein ALP1-like [Chenopodium quinoa]
MIIVVFMLFWIWYLMSVVTIRGAQINERKRNRKLLRSLFLSHLIRQSDVSCKSELRVNRRTFNIICEMLRDIGGLSGTRNMTLQEIVAMFLYTLAHHQNNRSIGNLFLRSGETVSRQFNLCLRAILKLHEHLLHKPIAISDECEDERWQPFKSCLGALDGTYINVRVTSQERGKYRTRKGTIAMNVLGACAPNMEFIYVLPGWEGSAHDVRVLLNALSRPNGLRVPRGNYYLVDASYTNCDGFLAPYRGKRYHLKEWTDKQPESAEEYFNMKHARARNVVERCFGLLKGRWSTLRSPSFFPIRTQGRIVMACCLLHNLIRRVMPIDDIEEEELSEDFDDDSDDEPEYITSVATSDQWTNFRNKLAQDMFNGWRARGRRV